MSAMMSFEVGATFDTVLSCSEKRKPLLEFTFLLFWKINLMYCLLCVLCPDYLFSLGKLTSEHVSKTAMQLKSVLEDKVVAEIFY